MNSLNEFETVKQALGGSPLFEVKGDGERLIATRRRSWIPRRGIFRLLIPQARIFITHNEKQALITSLRPDPLAVFMLVMLLGGVAVELFLDPVKYPRDYPPGFIYALAIFYIGALIVEMFYTRKQFRSVIQ